MILHIVKTKAYPNLARMVSSRCLCRMMISDRKKMSENQNYYWKNRTFLFVSYPSNPITGNLSLTKIINVIILQHLISYWRLHSCIYDRRSNSCSAGDQTTDVTVVQQARDAAASYHQSNGKRQDYHFLFFSKSLKILIAEDGSITGKAEVHLLRIR